MWVYISSWRKNKTASNVKWQAVCNKIELNKRKWGSVLFSCRCKYEKTCSPGLSVVAGALLEEYATAVVLVTDGLLVGLVLKAVRGEEVVCRCRCWVLVRRISGRNRVPGLLDRYNQLILHKFINWFKKL